MNPNSEMADDFADSLGAWVIRLDEPELPGKPTPALTMESKELGQPLLPFRLDELPTEGFSPKLRRFDEAA